MQLAYLAGVHWAILDGEAGWRGIQLYTLPCRKALNMVYYKAVSNLNTEQREEFDGYILATAEEWRAFTAAQKQDRYDLIVELGEIG